MKELYTLKCIGCKREVDEAEEYTNCPHDGLPLEVVMNYEVIGQRINQHALRQMPPTATKYLDFYPIRNKSRVITLNEGGTPLYHAKNLGKELGLKGLYIKVEGANPTGAFKDRGTMVEITKAIELGKKAVVCASSGNMAASVSAYCAKANMPAYVLVPQGTPIGKLAQTLAYGARIIQIRGSYDAAAKLTRAIAVKNGHYLAGDYAYRLEGQKSQAFEIAEQLGWRAPDRLFIPIGCGTNGSAIWKGFREYRMLGFTDNLPKMVGVQARGADPVITAFNGKRSIEPIAIPKTVASAICVGDPLDGRKIINALNESNGAAVSVEDEDILEAEKLLARMESIFVEPSAATSLAALQQMVAAGAVDKDETIVLVMTGVGLKDPVTALKVLYSPPVVDPQLDEVQRYLNYGFYEVMAKNVEGSTVLIREMPERKELSAIIRKNFHTELSEEDLDECMKLVESFIEKGKSLQQGDLQHIIEKSFRKSAVKERPLKINDFSVKAGLHQKSVATVRVSYRGKEQDFSAEGVGPVDGIINAVKKSVENNGFRFALTDYEVAVSEGGTDASVNVKMTMEDERKNKVISMGTSPDIIVASVKAFEEGYNLLWAKNRK